jgi:hypothetical protein
MKLGTLLTSLAKKSGVDTTQKEFIDLLAIDVDIPDAVANKIDQDLMGLNAAKVHPEIQKEYRRVKTEALNGVDTKITDILTELGITEADDVVNEKNSYEKISMVLSHKTNFLK